MSLEKFSDDLFKDHYNHYKNILNYMEQDCYPPSDRSFFMKFMIILKIQVFYVLIFTKFLIS